MSPVEWYYAHDNKQQGPVSPLELKRLATTGELAPDDLVWREGMTEWASARNVRGLFDEEDKGASAAAAVETKASEPAAKVAEPAAKSTPAPPARHLFDVLLDKCRPHFNAHFVDSTSAVFRACGSYGLFVAAAMTAVLGLIAAVKIGPVEHLLYWAIWILALLALHYVAGKSCNALDEVNRRVEGRLSSSVLPNCLAVLAKLAGVAALLGSVAVAIEFSQYEVILLGVAAFLVCAYLAAVALNPAALNIAIAPEPIAGEEAIGAVMLLLKALVRLTPVAFGVGVVSGTVLLGVVCLEALAGGEPDKLVMMTFVARYTLLASAALPLAAYLLFLLVNLILSLWRSVLSLPVKLDELAQKTGSELKGEQHETSPTTRQQ